jgi:hypothetical protein
VLCFGSREPFGDGTERRESLACPTVDFVFRGWPGEAPLVVPRWNKSQSPVVTRDGIDRHQIDGFGRREVNAEDVSATGIRERAIAVIGAAAVEEDTPSTFPSRFALNADEGSVNLHDEVIRVAVAERDEDPMPATYKCGEHGRFGRVASACGIHGTTVRIAVDGTHVRMPA